MNDELFDDPIPPRGRRSGWWWQAVFVVVIAVAAALAISFRSQFLPPTHQDRFTRGLREQIVAGDDPKSALRELNTRPDRWEIVARLADDPDPKVRRVAVGLVSSAERSVGAPIVVGRFRLIRPDTHGGDGSVNPLLQKFLVDPDPTVRKAALASVALITHTRLYEKELLQVLWHGPPDERVLVAQGLAHWNGREALSVFASAAQPSAVRTAAFRGVRLWRSAEFGKGLDLVLRPMLDDPDPAIRILAVEASRWVETAEAVPIWLAAARSPDGEVARRAVAIWIDEMISGHEAAQRAGRRLEQTTRLLRQVPGQPGLAPPEVAALAGYVLGRVAVGHAAHLDEAPDEQTLWHLKHVFDPLTQIPRELQARAGFSNTFAVWLPHESATGPPAARNLVTYLLEQLREPIEWCQKHRDLTGLRGLDPAAVPPDQPDTLGRYLDRHRAGSFSEFQNLIHEVIKVPRDGRDP